MIPLSGSVVPDSRAALHECIAGGLKSLGITPKALEITGADFPGLELIRADLRGAHIPGRQLRPLKENAAGTLLEIRAGTLDLHADPFYVENMPLRIQLNAAGAKLRINRSGTDGLTLSPWSVASGSVSLSIAKSALESLVQTLVSAAASKQGVEIKKTALTLAARSPRELDFRADVTAKMFVMNATLPITGTLLIDEQLNARVKSLSCKGEGMIGGAANALLTPHFQQLESRNFPLLDLSVGEIRLREVSVSAGESVQIRGVFAESRP